MDQSKIAQGISDAARAAKAIPQNTGEQYPLIFSAVVTGGDASGGYTVQALKADLTAATTTWARVATMPAGGTIETGDQVVLIVSREGDLPRILQTGAGASGAVVGVNLTCRYFSTGA